MIIDAHTHIFSPDVLADMGRYAKQDSFFDFLYNHPKARMVGADEILAAMDAACVDKAVLAGWPWQRHDVCVEQNTWVMQVAQQYPDRLLPLAAIQPNAGSAAVEELERCVAGGIVGLGELNADGQQFQLDDPSFLAVARKAAALGVPVLLHTNESVGHKYPGKGQLPLADIYNLAVTVPELDLVLAHWGGGFPFFELMPEVKSVARRIVYDTAASPLLYRADIFRTVIGIVGSQKVLFGSDFPLILYPKRQKEPDFRPFLSEIQNLELEPERLADVFCNNSMRVYCRLE